MITNFLPASSTSSIIMVPDQKFLGNLHSAYYEPTVLRCIYIYMIYISYTYGERENKANNYSMVR